MKNYSVIYDNDDVCSNYSKEALKRMNKRSLKAQSKEEIGSESNLFLKNQKEKRIRNEKEKSQIESKKETEKSNVTQIKNLNKDQENKKKDFKNKNQILTCEERGVDEALTCEERGVVTKKSERPISRKNAKKKLTKKERKLLEKTEKEECKAPLKVKELKVLEQKTFNKKCNFDFEIFSARNFFENKDLFSLFAKFKNNKIFNFYIFLRNKATEANSHAFYFNRMLEGSYAFEVTLNTVFNWLNDLEKLGLLIYKKLKGDLVWVEMLDYTQAESYKETINARINQKKPKRFYREVQLRIEKIIKAKQESKNKEVLLNGEYQEIIIKEFNNKKELMQNEDVYIRVLEKYKNLIFEKRISYQDLVGKELPNLKCHYHRAIVNKKIKVALNLDELRAPEECL